jgi:hypothetical protein
LYFGTGHALAASCTSKPFRIGTAILLRENYRENGKVHKRTLCNLSDWPTAHIEELRGVLKGGTVIPAEREAFTVIHSLPHGHPSLPLRQVIAGSQEQNPVPRPSSIS